MKHSILQIIIIISLISCKENSSKKHEVKPNKEKEVVEQLNTYELGLLDYRTIDGEFNKNFKLDKFGVRKFNDSLFYFVLRLKNDVSEEEINKYSMGIISYDPSEKQPHEAFTNLKVRQLHDKNYLVINRVPKDTKYLDSIEFYIYQKNNFNASGKLGKIKVFDVLFE